MPSPATPKFTDARKDRFDKVTIAIGVVAWIAGALVMMATAVEVDRVYWTASVVSYAGLMTAVFSTSSFVRRRIRKTGKA